jgi:tripartite-type tricarboxylate transporter receptor subunit TctC
MLERHAAAAMAVAFFVALAPAHAQDAWPARVVRIANSLAAGSSADRLNRAYADALAARLNQRVLVDNRPGDGGNIAAQSVAKAPADGYTLLLGSTATLAIQATYHAGRLGYDMRRDFAPVSTVAQIPNGLFAAPDLPVDTFKGFVELAKTKPGQYSCASSGVGGLLHLTCELFKKTAGVDLLHVPHKGSTAFLPEIMEGRITIAFDNVSVYVPLVEARKLKVLAITTPQRTAVLPQVPTTAELGMPRLESMGLFGLFAPVRTPDDVVKLLSRESIEVLRQPGLREQLLKQGMEVEGSAPQALRSQLESEIAKWARVIREAGIKPGSE